MKARNLRRLMNVWPPYLFSGIRVLSISDDYSRARVRLRHHRLTSNFVGTHFGGSLYSMSDPFYMLMALHRLGSDYLVWDRAAEITYVSATREDVFADFCLDDATVDQLRQAAASGDKVLRWFETAICTSDGTEVARVRRQLYVRKKRGKSEHSE